MKIEIDLKLCNSNNLTPNQYVLLHLMYHKEFDKIEKLFTRKGAVEIRDTLYGSKYILDAQRVPFKQTILSTDNVAKLLGIRAEQINFIEFYNLYPPKVGTRILRASNIDTVVGRKHEKKYLARVRTIQAHEEAKKATKVFVAKQKQAGKLQYLPNIETVLNNSMWENWSILIDKAGSEELDWNSTAI